MRRHIRQTRKLFRQHDLTAIPTPTSGGHIQWRVRDAAGRKAIVYGASSPSCHRAPLNLLSTAKQALRDEVAS